MKNKRTKQTKTAPGNGARADINIEGELWEAAVRMRGNIAPADYKHYVLPLLFLRHLSLRYERRHEELERLIRDESSEYFTTDTAVAKDILNDTDEYKKEGVFIVPEKARWSYLVAHAQDDDIKLKLDDAMESLEKRYPELRGVLPKIYAGSNLDRDAIAGLINLFSRAVFASDVDGSNDVLGRVYEYFINNFASTEGTRGGEFFTPRSIVKLLVAMMQPEEGKVFDPACGSGGMFVQSAAFTRNAGTLSFYGQERVDTTLRLGKMNLLLHNLNGDIRMGNSLLDDKHPDLRAEFVVANPPFNLDGWGAERITTDDARLQVGSRRVVPTNSNANYFWMLHFLFHLRDGGTAGYVMANGSMTTGVTEEKNARVALVEEGFVDCIVQLPDKLFFGTGIPACLWFLSRNRDGRGAYRKRDGEILFIDARRKGVLANRRQRVFTDEEINEIAVVYHHYRGVEGEQQNIAGFCKTVTLEEVRAHDYKLTPGIYVGTETEDKDDTPFEVKMPVLTAKLKAHFAESSSIQESIIKNLEGIM